MILVFDIYSWSSYINIRKWKREIENHADPEIEIYLIGNTHNKGEKREIKQTIAE